MLMNKSPKVDVKTINLIQQTSKQIKPLKIILDSDTEVRATNFHGTSRGGRTYISPQLVFVRATGKGKSVDISFQIHQLRTIIESLKPFKMKRRNTLMNHEDINQANFFFS